MTIPFARIATLVGAVGSVAAMLRVGSRGDATIPKPAAPFLLVPLGSWLLVATLLALARSSSGSRPSAE